MYRWIPVTVSLCFLLPATWLTWETSRFLDRAEFTRGVVIGRGSASLGSIRKGGASSGGRIRMEYAICEFIGPRDEIVRFQSEHGYGMLVYRFPYRIGQTVEIAYDPDFPQRARILRFGELWFLPAVMAPIAALTLLWTIWSPLQAWRKRLARHRLEARGQRIEATVKTVTRNPFASVNGQTPWVVEAHWTDPDSGRRHRFLSESIWRDTEPRPAGGRVTVLVDPRRLDVYRMEGL